MDKAMTAFPTSLNEKINDKTPSTAATMPKTAPMRGNIEAEGDAGAGGLLGGWAGCGGGACRA
nr:MAG: hypothetical protein TU35_00985 [Thermoproteus sp. AZ2]